MFVAPMITISPRETRPSIRAHPLFHIPDDMRPPRGESVHLIEENDAGRVLAGLLEDHPEFCLALPVELVDDFGSVDVDEMGPDLVGDGSCDEGLSRSRRSGKENPPRGVDPERGEELGELQGKLDHLTNTSKLLFQPPDVLVRCPKRLFIGKIGSPEGYRRMGSDPEGPSRACSLHDEKLRRGSEECDLEFVSDDHMDSCKKLDDVTDLGIFRDRPAGIGRGEDQGVGLLERDFLDGAPFVHRHLGVVPRDAVYLNQVLSGVMSGGLGNAGDCGPAAGNHDSVSGDGPQTLHDILIHAGKALALILDKSFDYAQRVLVFSFHLRLHHLTVLTIDIGPVVGWSDQR